MKQLRTKTGMALGAAMLLHAMGCGSLYGGGGGGETAEVMGNILATNPSIAGRNIVVFVFRVKDQPADCHVPVLPDDNTAYESEELQDGETTFDLTHVKTGRLVIAFLLDNEGKDADGRIDPGDPIAVLDDPSCVLDDVPNKYVVEATDILVNFDLTSAQGFPGPGRAEADSLTEFPEP